MCLLAGVVGLYLSEFPERILAIDKDIFVEIATGTITTIRYNDLNGITHLNGHAFTGCDKLESVTLADTITYIAENAFSGCTNLKTINVPWAENAVANAPWGATNATINYNYGG